MNLLDFATTPVWRVWEEVRAVAAEDGVELRESELIGLAPLAAFMDVATHAGAPAEAPVAERFAAAARAIRLRDADPLMALELRLAAARDAPAAAPGPGDAAAAPGPGDATAAPGDPPGRAASS
jgi:hypothetical protein